MSKHTPGPWKVATTYKLAQRGAAEIVPWNDQGRTLALTQTVKGYSPDESLANARLISAAPDMLAALKWLADSASASQESPEAREWHTKDVWHGIELARAAIAKAEGNQ